MNGLVGLPRKHEECSMQPGAIRLPQTKRQVYVKKGSEIAIPK
jgi:hypothetical protein